eukprot:Clim_evm51s108 gene=Clim_evmTU51s108
MQPRSVYDWVFERTYETSSFVVGFFDFFPFLAAVAGAIWQAVWVFAAAGLVLGALALGIGVFLLNFLFLFSVVRSETVSESLRLVTQQVRVAFQRRPKRTRIKTNEKGRLSSTGTTPTSSASSSRRSSAHNSTPRLRLAHAHSDGINGDQKHFPSKGGKQLDLHRYYGGTFPPAPASRDSVTHTVAAIHGHTQGFDGLRSSESLLPFDRQTAEFARKTADRLRSDLKGKRRSMPIIDTEAAGLAYHHHTAPPSTRGHAAAAAGGTGANGSLRPWEISPYASTPTLGGVDGSDEFKQKFE